MTAQVSDVVKYRGEEMSLVAFSAGEPFAPTEHGYRPVMASTACYRGYVCEYEVAGDQLLLSKLNISHQGGNVPASARLRPPALNGVEAETSKSSHFGHWVFKQIDLPLSYTGGLIVARGFIRPLYVHMGFHPAWKYEEVHELLFDSGTLVGEGNQSERMAELRARMTAGQASRGELSSGEVATWIAESFSRDYTRRNS